MTLAISAVRYFRAEVKATKDSLGQLGIASFSWDSQGKLEIARDSLGQLRIAWDIQGQLGIDRDSLGWLGIAWDIQGQLGIARDSLGYLGIAWLISRDNLGQLGIARYIQRQLGISRDSLGQIGIAWVSQFRVWKFQNQHSNLVRPLGTQSWKLINFYKFCKTNQRRASEGVKCKSLQFHHFKPKN